MKMKYLLTAVTKLKCHCSAFWFPIAERRVELTPSGSGRNGHITCQDYFPKWHKWLFADSLSNSPISP